MIVGIETGGTKVVCGTADRPDSPAGIVRFPTEDPATTLARIHDFVAGAASAGRVDAIGVASFGPVNVETDEPRYGWITDSPKLAWRETDLLGGIGADAPVVVLSDVSGAALGEATWGAGRGLRRVAYMTVGTGVGVGVVRDGVPQHGNGFPELGHLLVRRHPLDTFAGVCPYHGDCAEGLVSGPAVLARWGADASHLDEAVRADAMRIIGYVVAQVAVTVALATGVERVVLGGGVLQAPGVLEASRAQLDSVTGGPNAGHAIGASPDAFLVPAALGDRAGLVGALTAAAGRAGQSPSSSPSPA